MMLFPLVRAKSQPATVTFVTSRVSDSDLSSYPFTGTSIGAAGNRHVIVAVGTEHAGGDTKTIDSVTVGGNAATEVETLEATNRSVGIFIISVPAGTTADIVVNLSATSRMCGIAVWAAYNLKSATKVNSTPSEVSTTSTTASFPSTETTADGIGVWYLICRAGARTFTWANATERFDETVDADGSVGTTTHTGGDATTTGANIAPVVTISGGTEVRTGVGATFR